MTQLERQLRDDHGCRSFSVAKKRLKKMERELDGIDAEIAKLLNAFKKKHADVLDL